MHVRFVSIEHTRKVKTGERKSMMARLVGAKNRQYWYRACVRYNFQPPGFSVVCHHGLLYIYIYRPQWLEILEKLVPSITAVGHLYDNYRCEHRQAA